MASSSLSQKMLPWVPWKVKTVAKRLLAALPEPVTGSAWTMVPARPAVEVDFELAWLQTTRWRFPQTKATRDLGYAPPVSFEEGMQRTRSWMDFPN
jgi:nucleoside-diphosphate-sugar epimerase